MAKYVSETKWLDKSDEQAFMLLSDLRNIQPFLPPEQQNTVECSENSVSFTIPKINQKGTVEVIEKTPFKVLKYGSTQSPIPITLWVQLKQKDERTAMRVTLEAKLNTMTKMMVGNKLKDGIEKIADTIQLVINQHQE